MKLAIVAITDGGRTLAEKLALTMTGATLLTNDRKVSTTVADNWHRFDGFIFIMAAGIVAWVCRLFIENSR